ncbi:PBP1 and LysM peptidoglycan-binding domain-containing protein [Owenweeksia hongkongensis]|uniref:ABC-type branched-chain amino acid transport system, periplasmic component n=1 Tax=Owenweeksia hongkongensis (strain DSM 17368 / CIP 108786 / JCM 12287 / NRRL B-23963 / UST20020801) TaxID=926562 RepID=G8R3V9_OWEHD|nr:LysM peptidoglycan-binding domain-containing protein [Owenweeksia hongkongensis]AEV31991.1 ABC-type branched-chain amino acid transport system, periplasmic component [Owenweeksia hongkongensis DSM 17368]
MIRSFLFIVFLSLISIGSFAQSDKYIFHDVVEGDTKYSISKEYHISIEDLEKFNPEIKSGLRLNTKLLIPKELMKKNEEPAPTKTVGPGFTSYTVKAGQTLYSIAKEYGVSVADIRKNNPQLADGLKAGMILNIPPKAATPKETTQKKDTGDKTHTVQPGETLYSLAIQYHVGIADIKKLNPELEQDGLKVGMVIKIPEPREEVKDEIAQQQAQKAYYIHVVKKTETAYSISRQYELSLDSLYLINPTAKEGLQIGQELNIPGNRAPKETIVEKPAERLNSDEGKEIASVNDSSSQKGEDENYFLYKVKSGDSFYSLKSRYNVSQEELEKLNPEIKRGLEVDKYIIIPQNGKAEDVKWLDKLFAKETKTTPIEAPSDNKKFRKDSLNTGGEVITQVPEVKFEDTLMVNTSKTYKVGLMLPFNVVSDTVVQNSSAIEGTQKVSLDFYNGLLMAADTLAKQGMNLDLNVYDTKNSLFHLQEKSKEYRQKNFDMVIGPLFHKNVEYIADDLRKQNVPVISPLSKSVDVAGRPNLIKCNPGNAAAGQVIADMLNTEYAKARVIFAYSSSEAESVQQVRARLLPRADSNRIDDITFTKELIERNVLKDMMAPGKQNVVIIFSEDQVFLSDLISNLRLMRSYDIAVIGPSKLLKIQTLEMDYLNKLNLSMPDANYIDYNDPKTISFIKDYREKYKAEPSQFAFQGYDVGMYFLQKLWKNGKYMMYHLDDEQPMLGTGFKITKDAKGGYQNDFMYLTGVRDLTLVKLEKK